jgi:predicted RNA binding protein YcfA (HicA-like mRNA interferase family)
MLRNLTSQDVAWILNQVGIVLKRRSKEDVFEGTYAGRTRVVIVPRNKRSIPQGTLNSIWRQAGINKEIAENLWAKK